MHHSKKAAGRFFIACRQSAELLAASEKAFDFVAIAVQVALDQPDNAAALFAGNDDLRAQRFDRRCHGVRIAGFVGQYAVRALGGHQQVRRATAFRLPAGPEHPAQRVLRRVGQYVPFGAQPAATAAEGFVADAAFFRPPAACAWARTTVKSSMTRSKSGSRAASNKRCQMPFWAQRQLRLRIVLCWPERAGSVR